MRWRAQDPNIVQENRCYMFLVRSIIILYSYGKTKHHKVINYLVLIYCFIFAVLENKNTFPFYDLVQKGLGIILMYICIKKKKHTKITINVGIIIIVEQLELQIKELVAV